MAIGCNECMACHDHVIYLVLGLLVEVNEANGPPTRPRPCALEQKITTKTIRDPAPVNAHHEIHSRCATVTTLKRRE